VIESQNSVVDKRHQQAQKGLTAITKYRFVLNLIREM